MSPTAFLGAILLAVIVGQFLDFAIADLKAQDAAQRLRIRADDPEWGENAAFSALSFAKRFLYDAFGPGLFSWRLFGACVAVAFVATVVIVSILTHATGVRVSEFGVVIVLLNGYVDAISLAFTRVTIDKAVSRGKNARFGLTIFLLSCIAYLAMGVAWCGWMIASSYFTPTNSGIVNPALVVAIWLPSLIFLHEEYLIPAAAPGALTTLFLLLWIGIPAFFVKTKRLWKPLLIGALERFASIPPWTGKFLMLLFTAIFWFATYVLHM